MSTTGMVNLQNAPRDVESILQIKRGIRYRLGLQIQMFKDNTEEQAFLSASDENQAQALAAHLQQYDANGQGAPQAQAPMPAAPAAAPAMAPAMPPQPAAPAMPPQPAAPAMPQPVSSPQVPLNMQVVGNQPVMPPTAMPQQPVAAPAPQPVMAPPPAPAPQPVVAPSVPAMPAPQPVTVSDPTNTGSMIPKKLDGIIEALKQVVEVSESNQAWIEEVHDHALGTNRVLSTVLLLQLVLAEQQGFDQNLLVKLMLSKDPSTIEEFLKNFATAEDEEGKE